MGTDEVGAHRDLPMFEHTDLESNHIRLLRPVPREIDEEVLKFHLIHVPFNPAHDQPAAVKYAALSYEWGDKTLTRHIEVDGRKLDIHENLWTFLERLHRCWEPQEYIWTDAICINQKVLAEKSAQVGMMGRIFEHAAEVLVWLGHGDFKSAHHEFRERLERIYPSRSSGDFERSCS